ncbi:hypothetical protein LTR36_003163 [Oleoguttula mirabilis]|uniref:Uncharacterized protein n=1 Tax=Oleoguttula mirabilis TaxID=1507867 RepID=A0AAV9JYP1_9PEZI|nr:hypothetical protein LTR36_003163 [Oleoguttula mirabilis]
MAPRIDDRWLWLGFGVFIFFAARNIRAAIKDTLILTELDPAQYEDKNEKGRKQPEDAINLAALKTLATSPNPNIANAAISLLVTRFAQTPRASQILAKDTYSRDETLRRQARTAVTFLKDWPLPPADIDRGAAGFDMPWTPPLRQRGDELDGGDDDDDEGNDGAFEGTPDSLPDLIDPITTAVDERLALGVGPTPSTVSPWAEGVGLAIPQPRVPHAAPETERRRRRREAMVLHEGGGGIVEGDIIRPR